MTRALIAVDVQHDFMPGGALGVSQGDQIVPLINQLMEKFEHVIATMDWHPPNHVSFAATHGKKVGEKILIDGVEQILWPVHCIEDTWGASLVKELHRERIEKLFHKGVDPLIDSYSVFFDGRRRSSTGLVDYLREKKIQDLYFVGVATDYCVLYSVLDALELGFYVALIRDACKPINLKKGDEEKALVKMKKKGARILLSKQLLDD